ncbi:hypothetical protein [Chryseobacterium binzhouense]|uniref:hypothetical protein n=1 Tax=Chryseobacterium binzhouense TaxID=2593646 RepID=UPI0011809BE1|nr:hypothetical protein [Chryseobacterium binzhouense]
MKKKFLLLFCFVSSVVFSQEYHFDYKCYNSETQLKGSYKGNKRTNIIYFNSINKDIIGYDYFFSKQPNRSFLLYDFKLSNLYSYSINQESKFSSLKLDQIYPIKIYSDEIIVRRADATKLSENTFLIKTFKSLKNGKSNLEIKILVEKTSYPMPKVVFMDLTPNIHSKVYDALLSKLDSEYYRIVEVTTDYKNGVIMHDDFSKCEKINLKILADSDYAKASK